MSLLSEVLTTITQKQGNPVFERELRGWSYIRLWRGLRQGCLPLMALVILLPAFCCAITLGLPAMQTSEPQLFPLFYFGGVIGMMSGGEMLLVLAGLIATALTATTISAEIETQTFSLLRMTAISPREIVLGKFGAAIRQLRPALITVISGRVIYPILLIVGIVVVAVLNAPSAAAPAIPGSPVNPAGPVPFSFVQLVPIIGIVTSSVAALIASIIAFVLGLSWYLIQPVMTLMLYAAIGLLGSAISKTRTSGMFAAAGLRVGLWMGSYALGTFVQVAIQLLLVPLIAAPQLAEFLGQAITTNPALAVLGTALSGIVWLVLTISIQIGVILLILRLTIRRTTNLPFNI